MSQDSQRSGGRGRGPRRGGPSGRSSARGAAPGGVKKGGGTRKPAGPPAEPLRPVENPPKVDRFDEFELHESVLEAIARMNIVKPTPIQALAIGPVLERRDIIAKAETGTGKTLAFGAPIISMIDADRSTVLALALCPTRELAEQVAAVLEQLGTARGIKVALIVGGEPAGPQVAALHAGAQVVVGTPGRVIDLYEQKFLSFPWTEFVVLDEADEMLEIGFIDDVKKILRFTPDERQLLLFSATFPDALLRLARDHTTNPAEIATASGIKTVDNIEQEYITLDDADRPLALIRMIERSADDDVFLVFCERRTEVERLMRRLERLSFSIKALHGGYDQSARFRVMSSFRTGEVKVLVATDVASRGLDVQHVTRVVNYSVPRSITDYTHRIGRTGRAGREGHAVTLVTHENMHRWKMLLRDASWEIIQVDAPGAQHRRTSAPPPERERARSESRERGAHRASEEPRDSDQAEDFVQAPERGRSRRESPGRRESAGSARGERLDRSERSDRSEQSERSARPSRNAGREAEPRRASRPAPAPEREVRSHESDDDERSTRRSRSQRPVRHIEANHEPVALPASRIVRKRDANDPPRRVRLDLDAEQDPMEEPRRSRGSQRSSEESDARRSSARDTTPADRNGADDDSGNVFERGRRERTRDSRTARADRTDPPQRPTREDRGPAREDDAPQRPTREDGLPVRDELEWDEPRSVAPKDRRPRRERSQGRDDGRTESRNDNSATSSEGNALRESSREERPRTTSPKATPSKATPFESESPQHGQERPKRSAQQPASQNKPERGGGRGFGSGL